MLCYRAYLWSFPPPRPLLHNFFAEPTFGYIPRWHSASPISDSKGRVGLYDDQSNVLVIVVWTDARGKVFSDDIIVEADTNSALLRVTKTDTVRVTRQEDRVVVFKDGQKVLDEKLPKRVVLEQYNDLHEGIFEKLNLSLPNQGT